MDICGVENILYQEFKLKTTKVLTNWALIYTMHWPTDHCVYKVIPVCTVKSMRQDWHYLSQN